MPSGIYKRSASLRNKISEGIKRAYLTKRFGFQKGNKIHLGRELSQETKEKIKLSHIGLLPSNETRNRMSIAQKNRFKKFQNPRKGKKCPDLSGKNHWNWQEGKTQLTQKIRNSIEYNLWRQAVYARDYWTCQICGKKGGKIHAHHIKSFSTFPELRLAIDNGITLCVQCHSKTDDFSNFGRKDNL